ncbi:HVM51 protein, partial [Polypterus senegalus]|nr:HVM51 protein [Polypterus senegalus]
MDGPSALTGESGVVEPVLFSVSGVYGVRQHICCGVTLTPSSSSETVRPGSSLTLTCQISGYSLTDCDYATDWIRQLPENALEWLSLINCHGSAGYASSVQGRFTMTRSSSSVSLEMRSMKAADSAIYYCARHPQCGGTCGSVTLTPSSFSEAVRSGSSLTLTCQVSGYSLTDSSYYTNWIRQLPQRTLEWLGYINAVGSTSYASSVQGRFTITKSSSSLSLEMRSLTEADSAVYYCARGTHVTLTPSSFSEAVRSGSSLTLTCQVSGYSLTDSSYYTNWIRQLPQRTLEWVGYINEVGGTSYASSVQGRITITKSSSSLSLEMRSLTEADSAVYYCARGTQ